VTAVRTLVAVLSAAFGACIGSLASTACSFGGECNCRPPMSIREGTFRVTRVQSITKPEAGPEGAMLTIEPDTVTVEYARGDAHVRAKYRVVTKYPL
jgi:hypothetical protein